MQRVSSSPHSSSLPQLVCDWNPSALPQLATQFSELSSKPQTTFSAYHSYKAYFEPLLLAEISADLSSALEKYQRTSLRQPKIRARREEVGTTLAVVSVQKVTRVHTHGFGWAVDLDSNDRRGPVGCVDSDVVALWASDPKKPIPKQPRAGSGRQIPSNAVLSIVIKSNTRTGCRVVLTKFPDGNENGVRTDLEEGEENEEGPPAKRVWNVLRLGSLTTMKREFQALQAIKSSVLMPKLLRPNLRPIEREGFDSSSEVGSKTRKTPEEIAAEHRKDFHSEYFFTEIVGDRTQLNTSQARAIIQASTCRDGFAVIQGPPGTGKTKTLIGLLNVIHMVQYQKYYESVISAMDPLHGGTSRDRDPPKAAPPRKEEHSESKQKAAEGSLLKSMMVAMNKTVSSSAAASEQRGIPLTRCAKRPRVLICAPSNSAVDEVLTRLMKSKLLDGKGNSYCPELARIGAGDRVSEAARPFTAEGQAEAFLDEVCGEKLKGEEQKQAQMAFLSKWQKRCNILLLQLKRTPKENTPASHGAVIELHEKLERMERDLRRLGIAASGGEKALSREEKLRQIARTYVEDAQLVFATLSGSASSILTKKAAPDPGDQGGALFDTVIIDEAAQATETSSIIPMSLGASRCILVGDPQQLPATVLSSGAAGLAYGQSLLERVVRAGQGIMLLDTQYRMHPAISSFPRRYFYNGRLVDDESVQGENRARPFHRDAIKPKLGPYVFLDISEGEERRSRDDRSIFNPGEAELAAQIYTKLKKDYGKEALFSPAAKVHGSPIGFGVVTPYKRQMQELRQSFDRAGVPTGDVEIDTVDSFQGREKDVIVFSCVRTASVNRGIGFVRDVRRMNVGLTRARASLIILGSAQALAEGSADWAELVEDANSRGCLISVTSVARCLTPPQPLQIEKSKLETKQAPQESQSQAATPFEGNPGHLEPYPRQTERRQQPFQRSDPRTRARKPNLPLQEDERAGNTEVMQSRMSVIPKPPQQHGGSVSGVGAAHQEIIQPVNQEPESAAAEGLQSTLQQMAKLFSDAGFKNTEAVQETLREHLQNGGELDVETVMAAVIATAQSGSSLPASSTGTHPTYEEETRSEPNTITPVDSSTLPLKPIQEANSSTGTTQASPIMKRERETEDMSRPEQVSQKRSNPEPPKKAKKHKKDRIGQATAPAEPSGWDMLFGGSKAGGGSAGPPEKKPKIQKKSSNDAKDSLASDKQADGEEPISSADQVGSSTAKDKVGEEKDVQKRVSNGKDSAVPSQGSKSRWNEQNDREEQRRAKGEFGKRVDLRAGRGSERGKHYPKRPRGSRQDHMDQRMDSRAALANENAWTQQVPFDPSMAAFQMVPNVMDPAMGTNPQAMLPMQAMQQHAMQQQFMQQQVLQQQAVQQQVLQQQLQQQAFQQEALRQQAAMMQMSGAGLQHPGMTNGYTGMGFDEFNGGGGGEMGNHNEGRNGWGGYRGRRGRGRGRGRGGRGRRY